MGEAAPEQQPGSMHEILESIKRIISDEPQAASNSNILDLTKMVNTDGSVTELKPYQKPDPFQSDQPKQETQADVLSAIDDTLNPKAEEKPKKSKIVDPKKVELELVEPAPPPKPKPLSEPVAVQAQEPVPPEPPQAATMSENQKETNIMSETPTDDSIVSKEAADKTTASLQNLMSKVAPRTADARKPIETIPFRSGQTVEDMVQEVLRPMMKEWMDNNLPTLVEEIVTREIKKLIPNG